MYLFKINSNIPIPIYLIASNIIQPKLPVALSYINDSGGLKKNKNQTEITKANKKQTLQVYTIKCFDRKTEIRRVQTESVSV